MSEAVGSCVIGAGERGGGGGVTSARQDSSNDSLKPGIMSNLCS